MDSLTITATCILCLLVLIYLVIFKEIGRSRINLPPGPTGLPFTGSAQIFDRKQPHRTLRKWAQKYGKICMARICIRRWIIINDAEVLREAFNNPVFCGRPKDELFAMQSGGGAGIIATEGPEWAEQRRFTIRHLRDFGFGKKSMEGLIKREIQELLTFFLDKEGKPFSPKESFDSSIVNGIWAIVSGHRFERGDILTKLIESEARAFRKMVIPFAFFSEKYLSGIQKLFGLTNVSEASAPMHKMINKVIEEHKDCFDPGSDSDRDFTDAYLREIEATSNPKSSFYKMAGEKSLRSVLCDLLRTGADTTSVSLSWSVLYLAVHQNVQRQLQEEIDFVVGKNRDVGLEDMRKLPYVDAVIMEVLRCSSIVPIGIPHVSTKEAQLGGYTIPEGCWIMTNIHWIHHNPQIWGDPDNFRPDRFIIPNKKGEMVKNSLVPFSTGLRQCIGEKLARDELFLFITSIFQKFHVQMDPSSPYSFTPEIGFGFVYHPKGYKIIVHARA